MHGSYGSVETVEEAPQIASLGAKLAQWMAAFWCCCCCCCRLLLLLVAFVACQCCCCSCCCLCCPFCCSVLLLPPSLPLLLLPTHPSPALHSHCMASRGHSVPTSLLFTPTSRCSLTTRPTTPMLCQHKGGGGAPGWGRIDQWTRCRAGFQEQGHQSKAPCNNSAPEPDPRRALIPTPDPQLTHGTTAQTPECGPIGPFCTRHSGAPAH
mmetsp:Transcript_1030/g.1921  ORF Transcript_1030/g.1921 Transcript_1030/m.1921 type:complete len:209 (-) Transcript_1030:87-713(-)